MIGQLAHRRAACLGTGVGLLGSGTHPTATDDESQISDKERYERVSRLLGAAVETPVAGLHVHIGMPDAETAIKVFNAMRIHLPLLQGLAANSPFRRGVDTGLASARGVTISSWPRSGIPRALRDYADFCAMADLLTRAAGVDDYTWFWWKLRPHPKLGTVEIRTLDAQSSLRDTEALVALTHCLARAAAERDAPDDLPTELLEEAMFRATRFGVHARLPDARGGLHEFQEVLDAALELAAPHAAELGCAQGLARHPGARGRRRWGRPPARGVRAIRDRLAAARPDSHNGGDVANHSALSSVTARLARPIAIASSSSAARSAGILALAALRAS